MATAAKKQAGSLSWRMLLLENVLVYIVHANISNLTKKMLHKSLGMNRATVCWVIKQFNATGRVNPKEKENVTKKGFPSLGMNLEF